jgi:glycogen synthase
MIKAKGNFLFEVSWEICNKVGGIWTVVRSKVEPIKDYYGDNYCLIGPYFVDKASSEFQETLPPDQYRDIFEQLKGEGITCHYGVWIVPGEPKTILLDFSGYMGRKNDIKTELWNSFQIDSLNSPYDFDEPVVWAYAVGRLIELLCGRINGRIVGQFHEWLSGTALLYLKSRNVHIATIFTTHATMLGRTITGNNIDLYKTIGTFKPEDLAKQFKVQDKHSMEMACAKNASVFTTVSEITGIEAEGLLGKKPDVLLPNGLDIEKFPTFEDCSIKHQLFRDKIREFFMYYFFPYYTFDLEQTLIFFTASRYEFHDKGIDVFIEALANLNQKLKAENSKKTVVAFFWVPAGITGIRQEVLENKTRFEDIKDSVDDSIKMVSQRILYSIISQQNLTEDILLGEDTRQEYKRKVMALKKKFGNPPLSTHELYNESNDPIIKHFKLMNLTNSKEDRVKVIFYPIYLSGADRILDLSYYEAMMGSHLGVFPSYYEPFGYTPLESGALAVPSVTTDCAGFGRFIVSQSTSLAYPGVTVLKRLGMEDAHVTEELSKFLYDYSRYSRQERAENKIQAKKLAGFFDWKIMVENYIRAHNMAVEKRWS